ncbi:hypothetical protein PBY51_012134 [Eleginops maclovinus]|uniref:Uncharacterized protein n=1 Tax=Eleginops maclovinus TaxID=56733 RepID=A0AAN7XVZ4_ELEMC|nr:hypothetical protein PBY51_012133 [Eleginops maclovinus]KAK5867665.1 hypothetical protein PBY51_012134 [Eleginops maclovinus]
MTASLVRPFAVREGCLMQSLAADTEQHSISLLPSLQPFRSSIPRSRHHYRCHQIAMMRGKPWSGPRVPHPLQGRECKTYREEGREAVEEGKSAYREERDRLLALSAGSEGAARTGEEE